MTFIAALVYDLDGNHRGHTVLNHEANKLKSTNLWSEEELPKLQEQLDRLNVGATLMAHWPQLNDPEVLAMLNDPSWEPLELEEASIVDDDRSHFVYHGSPEIGPDGEPTGETINGEVDEDASVIVYKTAMVPKEPIQAQIRTRKARETVARRRAGV